MSTEARSSQSVTRSAEAKRPRARVCGRGCGVLSPPQKLARALGNQAFAKLIQAKLTISAPNDPLEREADRVADQVLQMKSAPCHCGGTCPKCRAASGIQRKPLPSAAPAMGVTGHALGALGPGHILDPGARAFFEPRFGHDFGHVRVHTGERAARAAQSINARAFTLGRDIVFAKGEYARESATGRHLLAHELAHVIQQRAVGPRIMRRLLVDRPSANIPNPGGRGLVRTNAETVQGYLRQMAPAGNASVDRTSGEVGMASNFCPGFVGGLVRGAEVGYGIGSGLVGNIPVLGHILGGIGGFIGGLAGGIAGLFSRPFRGPQSPSRAAASATPTSSTCLCDFVRTRSVWTIVVNDTQGPHTASNRVIIPSPNNPKIYGAATQGGQLENYEPWLILAHELCGHAWLAERNAPGPDEGPLAQQASLVARINGQLRVVGPPPTRDQFLRHGLTVERENLIRLEHGLPPRGYRLRDPYCGESFWRARGMPRGPVNWTELSGVPGVTTYLQQCQFLRDRLPESRNRTYGIDEAIP